MKIALVHDWLRVNAGSEKVVSEMLYEYTNEDVTLFTLFNYLSSEDKKAILRNTKVKTSILQYFPRVYNNYRYLLPLMPFVIKSFYLSGYDLILSSSHAVAKGFRRDRRIPHICYCHTPMRYAWDLYKDYSKDSHNIKAFLYLLVVRFIRNWDYRTAKNVDYFIANSENVKRRIEMNYGREAKVIYPPVRVNDFELSVKPRKNVYLCVGRFVPYKKIDVIINAFKQMPDKKLLLIGDGYAAGKIAQLLQHVPNVTWLGYKNDKDLIRLMQESKACLFAAKEDFGIMCVEAQACGTPVIALNNGGYKETVIEGETGYLFDEQTEESIIKAVKKFEESPLTDHISIRKNAERFSSERFQKELKNYIEECMEEHKKGKKVYG